MLNRSPKVGQRTTFPWRTEVAVLLAQLDEPLVSSLRGDLSLVSQRYASARVLWAAGHLSEGLRLCLDALNTLLSTIEATEQSVGPLLTQRWADLRVRLGRLKAVADQLPDAQLDEDLSPLHSQIFEVAVRELGRALRRLKFTSATRLGIYARRASRVVLVAAAAFGLVALVALQLRTTPKFTARASATFGNLPQFAPQNILDKNPQTEWLLPDQSPGWIDVEITPPSHVKAFKILNGHDAHYNDRATKAFAIEFFDGPLVVKRIEGEFGELDPHAKPLTFDVGLPRVERVRVQVKSFFLAGAGLAEVEIVR